MNPIIAKGQKEKNDGFEYIKDADTLRCPMGQLAMIKTMVKARQYKDGYRNPTMVYNFSSEICQKCSQKEKCLGKRKDTRKRYSIKMLTGVHKEQEEFEKTEYFNKTLKKQRYKIEAKNAETKIIHGLDKAKSMGLFRMRIQSYLTHITINIKRIIKQMEKVPA